MKKKFFMHSIFIGVAVVSLFLSCSYEDTSNVTNITVFKDAEEESLNFVSEGIPCYSKKDVLNNVLYIRCYDKNPYVQYVAAQNWLEMACDFKIEDVSYSDGKYKYVNKVNGKKFSLVIDVKKDTIYCPDWAGYMKETYEYANNNFIKKILLVIRSFTGMNAQTFNLSKYGMKIYGGTEDAYVPLSVMNVLFACTNLRHYIFNGKALFAYTQGSVYSEFTESDWYEGERPAELIEQTYNLLAFTHDYLYGQPGYYGFADDGTGYADMEIVDEADKLGFDDLLKKYAPKVRAQLKSSSYKEYMQGFFNLLVHVYGDCHTAPMFDASFCPFGEDEFNTIKANVDRSKKNTILKKIGGHIEAQVSESLPYIRMMNNKAQKAKTYDIGNMDGDAGLTHLEVLSGGKTAVIRFDHFEWEDEAWTNYFARSNFGLLFAEPDPDQTSYTVTKAGVETEVTVAPVPKDTMGLFYRAFYKILNDEAYKNVENVIIDLSCNGGGAVYAYQKGIAYLLGKCDTYLKDAHTGACFHEDISADLNLDGIVDAADFAYHKRLVTPPGEEYLDANGNKKTDGRGLHFAVLTSFMSFSCGNAFPNTCYDAGIPVIGERSGGGSCWVGYGTTADGFPYQFSSKKRDSHPDWTSVESGAPVTVEMPYSAFYDDAELQKVMEKLFK